MHRPEKRNGPQDHFQPNEASWSLLDTATTIDGIRLPKFFRLALGGDKTRLEDMDFLLNETRRLGYNITSAETDE
jgi:hypothetical protein